MKTKKHCENCGKECADIITGNFKCNGIQIYENLCPDCFEVLVKTEITELY